VRSYAACLATEHCVQTVMTAGAPSRTVAGALEVLPVLAGSADTLTELRSPQRHPLCCWRRFYLRVVLLLRQGSLPPPSNKASRARSEACETPSYNPLSSVYTNPLIFYWLSSNCAGPPRELTERHALGQLRAPNRHPTALPVPAGAGAASSSHIGCSSVS
jgi:hypothetical protein